MIFDLVGLKSWFNEELIKRKGDKQKLQQLADFVEDYIEQFRYFNKEEKAQIKKGFFHNILMEMVNAKKIEIKTI